MNINIYHKGLEDIITQEELVNNIIFFMSII